MALDDMPIFAMLRGRLSYLSDRQRVIAENVANADTPGYTPRDLQPFVLPGGAGRQAPLSLAPVEAARTSAMHIPAGSSARARPTANRARAREGSETTLDGNSVVLEDEMMRMTEARMDYDAAIGFYQKSLNLLRMASRRPGSS